MGLGSRLTVLIGMLLVIGVMPAAAQAQSADCSQPVAGTASGDFRWLTEGNDAFDGREGNDYLNGRGGHDCLIGGAGSDTLSGGAGSDTLSGGTGNDNLLGDDGNDDITGGSGSDDVTAGAGNDVIDVFDGSSGDDVSCGTGTDTVSADPGDDIASDCETVVRGPRPVPTAQQICEDAGGTFQAGGTQLWRCDDFSIGQPFSVAYDTREVLLTACSGDGGSGLYTILTSGGSVIDSEVRCRRP